ncbi:hypothetical protein [Paenibacillus favisporus]|uniref:hypothetical protein n=1 Tax=Paenibacillus favisporus TaxID=221028 RepID=UPI0013D0BD31|nr:hypothetical protein [Paenibacillus favisporus]
MRLMGMMLLGAGLLLVGLSGFEKVLIYAAQAQNINDVHTLKDLTPDYIWNITNITLVGGIVIAVLGLFLFLYKRIASDIQQQNREFEDRISRDQP